MKHIFAEKSAVKTFLGMLALVSAASFVVLGCIKEKPALRSEKKNPKKNTSAKMASKPANKSSGSKRVIYLTFDDGPNKGTENLLSIIHKRKVPITTFIAGKHVYGSKKQKTDFELLKNDSLIEIANHSYTHANNKYSEFYRNSEAAVHDFNATKDSFRLANGIARTPGRNIWRLPNIKSTDIKSSSDTADELKNSGYRLVGWDLEWKPTSDMTLKGSHKEMLKRVDSIFFNDLEKTARHLVFLTHDQYLTDENSVKELDLFIQKLQKTNRFEFRKISEYPHINDVVN